MKLSSVGSCALLMAFCFAVLPGCDSSSGGGNGPSGGSGHDKAETVAPLYQRERALILSADGRPLEQMIQTIESVVESRVLAGNQINMSVFSKLLDATFTVHCEQECSVKERELE